MFGPARMPAGWPGSTSSTIWLIRILVPCSRPLTRLTTGTHGRSSLLSSPSTPRKPCEGTPMTITSAQCAASAKSFVARRVSGSSTSSPRYCELRWLELMSSAVSAERTHCTVGPRRAQMDATVVPQDPPPRTTTCGSRRSGVMAIKVVGRRRAHREFPKPRAWRRACYPTSCAGALTRPNTMSSSILSRKRKSIASAKKS